MYCIIPNGELMNVSVLIGMLYKDACVMMADTRKSVMIGGEWVVENDRSPKAYKINRRVLVGATGGFPSDGGVLAPFDGYRGFKTMDVHEAAELVADYLYKKIRGKYPVLQNYIVAGIGEDGGYHMYGICYDPREGNVEVTPYRGAEKELSLTSFPPGVSDRRDEFNRRINEAMSLRDIDAVIEAATEVLLEVAAVDETVNDDIRAYIV